MKIDRKKAEDAFENFLILMDDQLDWLSAAAEQHHIRLEMTPDDLPKLEQLFALLAAQTNADDIPGLIVVFARHLGELVRLNYGGNWTLLLADAKNVNYNTPVIVGHTSMPDLEFAPLSVMRAYALRRMPGTLQRAVEAHIHPQPLDLSGLIEED